MHVELRLGAKAAALNPVNRPLHVNAIGDHDSVADHDWES